MKAFITGIVLALFVFSQSVFAVDPTLDWKTIESQHIYVHYADGNKAIAERALAIAEAAHQRLSKELNWTPVEKTHVVLSDETDQPNGLASPLFFNHTILFLAPPTSVNTLEDFDDWFTTLIFHEYTHIIHLDKSTGAPKFLRNIFGRFLLLFPNLFQPSWVVEGLATYEETDLTRGIGRGQSTFFASMMREEVANGVQPISHVNLPVSTWPAGTTRYLYGVYFMTFLKETYGEEKLQAWVEEYSNNLLPFFINTNADQTFGKDLSVLWQEFQQWLEARFQPQIDSIKARGITQAEQVSPDAYRTGSVHVFKKATGDEVYYVRNGGYKRASLARINANGTQEDLVELNGGANLDGHASAGLLLTQTEYCNNYTAYKDIYRYIPQSNELKRLTECGRYLFASWHPNGRQMVAVHHDASRFELHLLDSEAKLQQVLWQADDGEIIGELDVSPAGESVVATMWRRGEGWNLERFDLTSKVWNKITTGSNITASPRFDSAGNILFSLEHEGAYNLFRYYTDNGNIEQLTNLVGGAFQPDQAEVGEPIYYTGYSAQGTAIYKIDDKAITAPAAAATVFESKPLQIIDYAAASHAENDYSPWSNMYPRWWFPVFGFSEQRSEFGVTTTGADALGIHNYSLTASYDSKREQAAGQINYFYADRLFLSAIRLNEITLDASSKLNRISNRDIASAVLAFPNTYFQTRSNVLLSVIYDETKDAELAVGAVPLESFEDHILGLAWLYDSADRNPLAISLVDGMKLKLVAEDSDVLHSDFSGQVYTLDWRQYIRTGKESVLAIRFLQGWGSDQPRPFKLGGEGVDADAIGILSGFDNEAVFNQRSYALRGYQEGLPQLRGRRAQLLTAEWRFPLQRVEKGIMAPPIGIMQWFANVFAEVGSAYQESPETYYSSAGVELTADINLFYHLVLRTRLGYAHGFDKALGDDRVYLKIGSSF